MQHQAGDVVQTGGFPVQALEAAPSRLAQTKPSVRAGWYVAATCPNYGGIDDGGGAILIDYCLEAVSK